MPSYMGAEKDLGPVVQSVMKTWHRDLVEAGVTVRCQFAHGKRDAKGEAIPPALRFRGQPAEAIITINSHKNRVGGLADVTMVVDGDEWPTWDDKHRMALVDLKLTELVLVRDKEGEIVTDDGFRPKLKRRPYDWQLAGYEATAQRHREDAVEVVEFRKVVDLYGQVLMPWGDDMAGSRAKRSGVKVTVGDHEFDLSNPLHKNVLQAGLDAVKAGAGAVV